MKIGIIGSGNMGRALGIRFSQLGHEVFFGGRTPEEAPRRAATAAAAASGERSKVRHGTLEETTVFADLLIWTTRETSPEKVLTETALAALSGKIVLDLNNRDFAEGVMGGGEGKGGKWFEESLGEKLGANLPDVHVFKALNTIAMETFDTSPTKLRNAGAQSFIAGGSTDKGIRRTVALLVEELGFEAVDLGTGPVAMRVAEAMADIYRYLIGHGAGLNSNLGFRKVPMPDLGAIGDRETSNYH